jgi:hypothetical protein
MLCLLNSSLFDIGVDTAKAVLQKLVDMQVGFFKTGGSVYKVYDDGFYDGYVSDLRLSNVVLYMVKGWIYFVFSPFPWNITSTLQLVTMPQVILWYVLAFFAVWGLFGITKARAMYSLVVLTYIFVITFSMGMISGNMGTALRHRDVILPLFFIFSAAGIVRIFRYTARTDD